SADQLVEHLLSSGARNSDSSAIRDLLRHAARKGLISLGGGIPAAELFPIERIIEATTASFDELGAGAAQYGLTEGELQLREVAAGLAEEDGAPALPDQILVTTGSQQALDLLGRVLVDRGDVVAVDDPAYLGALQALRKYEPELVGIPVDDAGLNTGTLEAKLRAGLSPKAVYTNPNFQNPTGATLSADRRAHLARLADQHDFLIIEDDPYAALRFRGENLPSMASMSERVIRVRTVSKTLAPGLRVAWTIGPARLIEALAIAKQAADLHTSTLTQHITARLVGDAEWFSEHRASLAPWYRTHCDALMTGLAASFGETLTFDPPDGGMFLWAKLHRDLPPGSDTVDLFPVAIEHGVSFVPGSAFAVDTPRSAHLRLSYVTASPEQLGKAAARLPTAIDAWLSAPYLLGWP
ncbi:MAG: PLP-dependent aminotransferase family protein, partial [Thermoanaerobaculales bacterium]